MDNELRWKYFSYVTLSIAIHLVNSNEDVVKITRLMWLQIVALHCC
jgi:hypothetical protein